VSNYNSILGALLVAFPEEKNILQQASEIENYLGARGHSYFDLQISVSGIATVVAPRATTFSSNLDEEVQYQLINDQADALSHCLRGTVGEYLPQFWNPDSKRWISFSAADEISEKDLSRATSVALFAPAGQLRIEGLILKDVPWSPLSSQMAEFHSLGLALIYKRQSLLTAKAKKLLSSSERNCLVWSACGKTSHEIALILSLSEHTVNHYFVVAAAKLQANNRAHAIAKAIKLGIIGLDEIN